jgi:hypothetical protein
MAGYNNYDSRLDSLVMEARTLWDSEIGELSEEDKTWLAEQVHQEPELAAKIAYERSHTGFTREITVTLADIERLYDRKISQ